MSELPVQDNHVNVSNNVSSKPWRPAAHQTWCGWSIGTLIINAFITLYVWKSIGYEYPGAFVNTEAFFGAFGRAFELLLCMGIGAFTLPIGLLFSASWAFNARKEVTFAPAIIIFTLHSNAAFAISYMMYI